MVDGAGWWWCVNLNLVFSLSQSQAEQKKTIMQFCAIFFHSWGNPTYILATFVHISNISAVTDPFFFGLDFCGPNFSGPNSFWTQNVF